jgi:predicted DNA binding CopG/RHH family protein
MKKKIVKAAPKKVIKKKVVKAAPVKAKKAAVKKVLAKKIVKKTPQKAVAEVKTAKRKPVSIRILTSDIETIKIKAAKLGVPYQTYINILIHRDAVSE